MHKGVRGVTNISQIVGDVAHSELRQCSSIMRASEEIASVFMS